MKIDIPDLPGNSNMEKATKEREVRKNEDDVTPKRHAVVKGHVKQKQTKTTLADLIIKQDFHSAAEFAFINVIIPRFQNLVVDTITSVIRGIFLGENSVPSSNGFRTRPVSSIVNYNKMHTSSSITTKAAKVANSGFKYNIVTLDSYGDAQLVLDKMEEMLETQGYVSIADMYECVDASCPYTYNYYGWTDISKAKIVEDGGEYWIKLPSAYQIKD